jgi:hypothetical protein
MHVQWLGYLLGVQSHLLSHCLLKWLTGILGEMEYKVVVQRTGFGKTCFAWKNKYKKKLPKKNNE